MDGAKEDLMDMFIVHTTEEIQVDSLVIFYQILLELNLDFINYTSHYISNYISGTGCW